MLLKITKRCFSKIIVAANFDGESNQLFETEKVHVVALLQLLESAYNNNIWSNLGVVTFEDGGEIKHILENVNKVNQNKVKLT